MNRETFVLYIGTLYLRPSLFGFWRNTEETNAIDGDMDRALDLALALDSFSVEQLFY
jgi:hypothetical protein